MLKYREKKFEVSKEIQKKMYLPKDTMNYTELLSEICFDPRILINCEDDFARNDLLILEACLLNPDVKKCSKLYLFNFNMQKIVEIGERTILKNEFEILEALRKSIIGLESQNQKISLSKLCKINCGIKKTKRMLKQKNIHEKRILYRYYPLKNNKTILVMGKRKKGFMQTSYSLNFYENYIMKRISFCEKDFWRIPIFPYFNENTVYDYDQIARADILLKCLDDNLTKDLLPLLKENLKEDYSKKSVLKFTNLENTFNLNTEQEYRKLIGIEFNKK